MACMSSGSNIGVVVGGSNNHGFNFGSIEWSRTIMISNVEKVATTVWLEAAKVASIMMKWLIVMKAMEAIATVVFDGRVKPWYD